MHAPGKGSEEGRIAWLAQQRQVREALAWFQKERNWINERHAAVCRVPAPTFLEGRRAAWMAEELEGLGWEAGIDAGGNVIAWANRGGGDDCLAVTAHLDTVLAPSKPEDIKVEGDGTLRGPGVADNGAGLAALLALGRVLRETEVLGEELGRVVLVANVGEEGEGNLGGMRYLCGASELAGRLKTYIVLDGPAVEQVTNHALASRRFEIEFTGPGGHSWSDFGAANPVHALSRMITLFEAESRKRWREDIKSSFNFGLIEGGASINSIPSQALAKLDLRSEDEGMLELLVRTLHEAVERSLEQENRQARGNKLGARIKEIGHRPGGRLAEDSLLIRTLLAVDGWLGIRSRMDCSSTDANIPLSKGLAAVSIGAGGSGGGAHTAGEWYRPQGRELGLRRIVLLVKALLEGEGMAQAG